MTRDDAFSTILLVAASLDSDAMKAVKRKSQRAEKLRQAVATLKQGGDHVGKNETSKTDEIRGD